VSIDKTSVNYFKDIIKEKDNTIEKLKKELQNAKILIVKMNHNKNTSTMNSFEVEDKKSNSIGRKNETFSERKNIKESNLFKSMSMGKKDQMVIKDSNFMNSTQQFSSLFRHSNKQPNLKTHKNNGR
jgi:hypothetical protein